MDSFAVIDEIIRRIWLENRQENPEVITDKVIAEINSMPGRDEIIRGVIRRHVINRLRGWVRADEKAAYPDGEAQSRRESQGWHGSDKDTESTFARRLRLHRENFFAGPGFGYVAWGEATVEQHQAAISYLEAQRRGISKNIWRHQNAISEILQAGVSCLDEVTGFSTGTL